VDSCNRYGRRQTARSAYPGDLAYKPDIVHTYNLQLSSAGEARLQEELLEAKSKGVSGAAAQENTNAETNGAPERMDGYFLHDQSDARPGPIPPPIFVVHDPPPTLQVNSPVDSGGHDSGSGCHSAIDEAHLYLSLAHEIGCGSHSMVYQGEWELPRTMFLPPPPTSPVLCKECVEVDVKNILVEEDGENGERMEERWREKSAVLLRIVAEINPSIGVRFSYDGGPGVHEGKVGDTVYTVEPQKTTCHVKFEGPVRPIRTTVEWQDPSNPTCPHLSSTSPIPPTAKVRVVAKLSMNGDQHLDRETRNYQDFDQHMFEHLSGLNKVPRLNDLCPVGALVPQFYGYYVPQLKEDEEKGSALLSSGAKMQINVLEEESKVKQGYLSPILLLEDCGTCIKKCDLSHDEGCVNLVLPVAMPGMLTFPIPGTKWLPSSTVSTKQGGHTRRNILVQPGPITTHSSQRNTTEQGNNSFRLIDFGRSVKKLDTTSKLHREERQNDECYLEDCIPYQPYRMCDAH
jgi:hypothetical protein